MIDDDRNGDPKRRDILSATMNYYIHASKKREKTMPDSDHEYMRGSRKFCQRGSKLDNVFFFVDEGRVDPSNIISGPSTACQKDAIFSCFFDFNISLQTITKKEWL